MKYLRKIGFMFIAVIFVAVVALGTCIIFSVKNVNVSYLNYGDADGDNSSAEDTIANVKKSIAESCRGSLITFVDEDTVRSCVGEEYVMESFEKIYPCTINVKIRERVETYAVLSGDKYNIYDSDGVFLRSDYDGYLNSVDSAPNVLLEGTDGDEDIAELAKLGEIFVNNFSALRSAVDRIVLDRAQSSFEEDVFIFHLRCGLTVEVQGKDSVAEKLSRAAREFSSLTGEQKLSGTIYCYVNGEGDVRATYKRNK